MQRFKTIKNYKKVVEKIITDKKLNPKKKLEDFIDPTHHTATVACSTSKKEKALLRILITSDVKKNNSFVREFKFYKILKKYNKNLNKLPLLIDGSDKKIKWMLRKFYNGKQLGDFWGADKTKLTKKLAKSLINYILELQNLTFEIDKKIKLQKRNSKWFINDWKKDLDYNPDFIYKKFIKKYFSSKEIKKIENLLINNKKTLNLYTNYFTHGDLMPQNILSDNQKKIFFIDWEEIHTNNPLFDVAYIFVNAWQDKNWRNNFLKDFIKQHPEKNKTDLKKLAKLNILIISLRMVEYAYLNLVHKNKTINSAFENHLKTIKEIIKI